MTEKLKILPTPKGWWKNGENCFVEEKICGDFEGARAAFCEDAKRCGFDFSDGEGGIYVEKDAAMERGEYKLCIKDSKVLLSSGGEEGAHYGFATLLQLMKKYDGKLLLESVTVCDKPDCAYRGLLVDCARSLHPAALMEKYVDMCRLYKIKYLHIHFSDDESYALPSKAFPLLTTEGRSYTEDDIARLRSYASSRGVSIVPEIDTPGHSTVLQQKYPEVFGDKGILKFTQSAIDGTKQLYRELCELFPESEYIHIGGDESRLGWWIDCPESEAYGRQCGYLPEDSAPGMSSAEYLMLRYLAHFIAENAKTVISCGKKPIVWEGFHKITNGMIPKECSVMVFDSSYQLTSSLVSDGFDVINCSWLPTYVVTPTWFYSESDCFDWDICSYGTINEASPYCGGMMRLPYNSHMIGGQLSSWGDTVEKSFETPAVGRSDEFEKIRRRLPYISENTWNISKRTDFDSAADTLCAADKVLDALTR